MHQTSHWVPGQWMGSKDLRSKLAIRGLQGMGMASGLLAWPGPQDEPLNRGPEMGIWDTCLDVSRGLMGKMVIYPLS